MSATICEAGPVTDSVGGLVPEFDRKKPDAQPAHGCYPGCTSLDKDIMRSYRIQGIPDALASAARQSMRSPQYGHHAHAELATGYGPCRLCLQTFQVDTDERLLFTYQPFTDPAALPAPGPVFIHEEPCARYDGLGLPPALLPLPLVLEGYGDGGTLLAQRRIEARSVDTVLAEVFDRPDTRYAHIRNGEAGCFIARVDRAQD